jgi:hypothetical protein
MQFLPDWHQLWTIAEAEAQLKDFKFDGPGLYLTDTDTMVVMPSDDTRQTIWKRRKPSVETKYHFYVYNCESSQVAWLVTPPVRQDDRK